jgi:hypothetical protein
MGRTTLDHIGDVDLFPVQIDQFEHGVQKFPGGPDEGNTLQIFLFTGTFSDQQYFRMWISDSENQICPFSRKAAAGASGTGLADLIHFHRFHQNGHLISSARRTGTEDICLALKTQRDYNTCG